MTEQTASWTYSRSIRSGTWFLMSALGQKFLQIGTFFFLARLLAPQDYGVITVVLLVTGLANGLTTIPFGDALTQKKDSIETYLDPVWTFDLIRSLVLGAGIFLGGGLIARFFHLQDASSIAMIRWSGMLLLIPALSNIRFIYFYKQLNFRKFFYRDMVAQLAFTIAALSYAYLVAPSPWALFAGYFFQSLIGIISVYVLYPSWPKLSFRFKALAPLMGYSAWVYGQDVLETLFAQVDKVFLGRLLNTAQLGIYAKAKEMAGTANGFVFSVVSKVAFPAYAIVQTSPEKLRVGLKKSLDVVLLSSLPFALLLLLGGDEFVRILLGQKWMVIVQPLRIFSFGNIFRAVTSIYTPIFSAIGRPDVNFKINGYQAALYIPFLYLGYQWRGMNGMAIGIVAVWMLMLLYVIWSTRRILGVTVHMYYQSVLSATIASFGTLGILWIGRIALPPVTNLLGLTLMIGGLGFGYLGFLYLSSLWLKRGPYPTLRSILHEIGVLSWKGKPE